MINNLYSILIVGAGGFVGSVLRYIIGLSIQGVALLYPYGTFTANCLACFVIGLIFMLSEISGLVSHELRLLIMTGFCGGLSTMSSMIFELSKLFREKHYLIAGGYLVLTIAACLAFFYLGCGIIKWINR